MTRYPVKLMRSTLTHPGLRKKTNLISGFSMISFLKKAGRFQQLIWKVGFPTKKTQLKLVKLVFLLFVALCSFTWCFFCSHFSQNSSFLPFRYFALYGSLLGVGSTTEEWFVFQGTFFPQRSNVLTAWPQQPSKLKFLVGHAMVHHSYEGVPCFLTSHNRQAWGGGSFSTGRSGLGHYMSLFFFYLCGRNLFWRN